MIAGLNPRKLVYRDGTSQSQRIVGAPNPGSVLIEERSLADFVQFAARFAKYLNFYDEENKANGDWSGFLNGGLIEAADQKKWLEGLISYANGTDSFAAHIPGAQFESPHLALFVTFLKLLENIKLQVNDFTKQHLDLYYQQLLGIDKKKPVPDVVNIIVKLTTDVKQLLVPKGTQLSAGKDGNGRELIYQTQKDTLISKAEVKNIKSLFVDKKVIGLREKRQNYFLRAEAFKALLNMALGYDKFDPKLSADELKAVALQYLLKEAELSLIADSVTIPEKDTEWATIYQTLESGYRRLAIRSQQLAEEEPATLYSLLQIALGNKDGRLPDYNNGKVDKLVLDKFVSVLSVADPTPEKAIISSYIGSKLMLSVPEFLGLAKSFSEGNITEDRWREIYILLETARSKRKDLEQPIPQETEWRDIVAVNDVKAADDKVGHFNTFGVAGRKPGTLNDEPVLLGMAVSSSRLLMREGKRSIDVYLAFNDVDELKAKQLADAINTKRGKLPKPFLFYISTSNGWLQLNETALSFGNFIKKDTGIAIADFTIKDGLLTAPPKTFSAANTGDFIIAADGTTYHLETIIDDTSAHAVIKAKLAAQQAAKRYTRTQLFLNAIHIRFELDEKQPEIVPPDIDGTLIKIAHQEPLLAFLLNDREQQSAEQNGFNTWYQKFNELKLANVHIDAEVKGLKTLKVQNDFTECNPKRPFSAFGNDPRVGNKLCFSHPELSGKVIDSLSLSLDWLGAPGNFAAYYKSYRDVFNDDMGGLNKAVASNADFVAGLGLMDYDSLYPQKNIRLFADDASAKNEINAPINWPASGHDLNPVQLKSNAEVINQRRYYVLELKNDFRQSIYSSLVTRQALNYKDLGGVVLNQPYLPVLKQLTAGYNVSVDVDPARQDNTGSLLHITPFGYAQPQSDAFMPHFDDQGELYIGLTHLEAEQNLSLLFQFADGSANPNVPKPQVQWSYLSNNQWLNFDIQAILNDSTNMLVNTGLLELSIPEGLTNNNTLMGNGFYWLRASVKNSTTGIPDLVDVVAQSVSAVFINNNNTDKHLAESLPPMTISSTVERLAGLKAIEQPFNSMYGKPQETDPLYYARVSERLRHKNRALTMWDYERLVLEAFPEIYKVKSLPANFSGTMQDTGKVDVIVVPRIEKTHLFNNFQPKLPAEGLLRISNYLGARIPPFVTVNIKNATYVQLRVRTAVRIKPGYPEAFYLEKLNDELKRFLAPWAYDEQAEIVIGGSVHHNVIVNFIAGQPYIDHVNTIKLLQSADGLRFRDVLDKNIEGEVSVVDPNVILVSADAHEIRLLTEEEFAEASTEGVGFMAIDVDLKINSDQTT